MVVIAYYYYAESASAELITPTRGSVWFLLGVIAAVLQNVLCVRPSRRTKGLSLTGSCFGGELIIFETTNHDHDDGPEL